MQVLVAAQLLQHELRHIGTGDKADLLLGLRLYKTNALLRAVLQAQFAHYLHVCLLGQFRSRQRRRSSPNRYLNFNMHIEREPNPLGDRVKISISGKFLPYKRDEAPGKRRSA